VDSDAESAGETASGSPSGGEWSLTVADVNQLVKKLKKVVQVLIFLILLRSFCLGSLY